MGLLFILIIIIIIIVITLTALMDRARLRRCHSNTNAMPIIIPPLSPLPLCFHRSDGKLGELTLAYIKQARVSKIESPAKMGAFVYSYDFGVPRKAGNYLRSSRIERRIQCKCDGSHEISDSKIRKCLDLDVLPEWHRSQYSLSHQQKIS